MQASASAINAASEAGEGVSVHGRSTTSASGASNPVPHSSEPQAGSIGSSRAKRAPNSAAPA